MLTLQDSSTRIGCPADHTVTAQIARLLSERIGADRFELWFGSPDCIRLTPSFHKNVCSGFSLFGNNLCT